MTAYAGSKAAVNGYGAILSIGPLTGTASPTFIAIEEVISVKIPDAKRDVVMTTNFQSPNGSKEKLGVAIDFGQIEFSCNRIPGAAGQLALAAANTTGQGQAYMFEVQLPVDTKAGQTTTGDLLAFSAIISAGGGFEISTDKPGVLSYTLDVSGTITLTAGS